MSVIPINIAELVGETPLVGLPRMLEGTRAGDNGVELFAKLEAFNPGGSVKDRIGVAMIEAAEAEGRIEPGRTTIVEATSGNTGIALAFVCAAKGYELVLTLPQGMSRERESLLRLYGARVDITESLGGMGEAVAAARAMARDEDVFLPDQFSNPANPEAHRRTTGPEIEHALDGRVDVLVAGVGTGGTITGVGEYLREHANPNLRVVAVEPRGSAVLSGGAPGAAPHPGHRRGLRAAGAQPRADRRGDRGERRRRDPDGVGLRQTRRSAGGNLLRRGAVGGAAGGRTPRVQGAADRRDDARLRRALRLPGVLRSLEISRDAPPGRAAFALGNIRLRGQHSPGCPLRCSHARIRAGSRGLPERCAATCSPRATATRPRAGVAPAEILATWPGIHALLAYRVAHAMCQRGRAAAPPR